MEKTAMQQLIVQLEEKIRLIKSEKRESRIVKGRYVDCLVMAKELLHIERQQIIDAFDWGTIKFNSGLTAEQYFDENYGKD